MSSAPRLVLCPLAAALAIGCGSARAPDFPTFTEPPRAGALVTRSGPYSVELWETVDGTRVRRRHRLTADFGRLAVPENRRAEASRLIDLPVLRVRGREGAGGLPVFWLGGGPGRTNLNNLRRAFLIERHDHVLLGYRGVDGAVSPQCARSARRWRR